MRYQVWTAAWILLAAGGCQKSEGSDYSDGAKGSGRYQGVGVYKAGEMWAQLSRADSASEPAAARLDDDQEVIVVIDNLTGELRQCGNLSGYCIAMNPWSRPAPPSPASLRKHAADLRREVEAAVAPPPAK
ncbi:MAG: hypothetical protein ACOY5Y_17730 [Pseudomonadota bacterium]|jgi:hypothetical protein